MSRARLRFSLPRRQITLLAKSFALIAACGCTAADATARKIRAPASCCEIKQVPRHVRLACQPSARINRTACNRPQMLARPCGLRCQTATEHIDDGHIVLVAGLQ